MQSLIDEIIDEIIKDLYPNFANDDYFMTFVDFKEIAATYDDEIKLIDFEDNIRKVTPYSNYECILQELKTTQGGVNKR